MVVISTLRAVGTGLRCLKVPLTGNSSALLSAEGKSLVLARMGHGGNVIERSPSRYEYRKWKDHVQFFFALGLIPMGVLITAINLLHGPCELTDVEEGYEPKHWEYYAHPIQRWFARYVYDNPQKIYERNLSILNYENQRRILRLTETRARQLMADNQDVKGWYYLPTNERKVIVAREYREDLESIQSSR